MPQRSTEHIERTGKNNAHPHKNGAVTHTSRKDSNDNASRTTAIKKAKSAADDRNLLKIKIILVGISPTVWRRLLVPSDTSLKELHLIIQTAMGWTNSHNHRFGKNGESFTPRETKKHAIGTYKTLTVSDLISSIGDEMTYEYHAGDGWIHTLTLEETRGRKDDSFEPICVGGSKSSPPEKCRNTGEYAFMLEAIRNEYHPEHDYILNHFGGFNPDSFDRALVNMMLAEKDYGWGEM
jgi:hypothetical protein